MKRDEIIEIAAELFHQNGFHNTGIQMILDRANIPKGSFYHYFKSKENLGLAVIEMHEEVIETVWKSYPDTILGMKEFFNHFLGGFCSAEFRYGCAVGNLVIELADDKVVFREKLLETLEWLECEMAKVISTELKMEQKQAKSLATFVLASFEGIILKTKVSKNSVAIDEFNRVVFEVILK